MSASQTTKTPSIGSPKSEEKEVPQKEESVTAQETVEVKKPSPSNTVFKEAVERVPSNWQITPKEGEEIYARNAMTGLVFEGTLSDFNKALRG
jgi:hypothetical protein